MQKNWRPGQISWKQGRKTVSIAWGVLPQRAAVIASYPEPVFSSPVHADSVPVRVSAPGGVDNEFCNRS
jgi:hypothetical protein